MHTVVHHWPGIADNTVQVPCAWPGIAGVKMLRALHPELRIRHWQVSVHRDTILKSLNCMQVMTRQSRTYTTRTLTLEPHTVYAVHTRFSSNIKESAGTGLRLGGPTYSGAGLNYKPSDKNNYISVIRGTIPYSSTRFPFSSIDPAFGSILWAAFCNTYLQHCFICSD